MQRFVLLSVCLCLSTGAFAADPWLFVRPGMIVSDHEEEWKQKCGSYVLTDNEDQENYLTCVTSNGDAITANVAPNGVAWWSRFWGAAGLEKEAFTTHFEDELSLAGPPASCLYFDGPADCWNLGSTLVTLPRDRERDGWSITMEDRTIFDPG